MTPPMPHKMVSQSGMLSRLLGATNLPSRPIMMPATITPMISIYPPSLSCTPNATAAYRSYPILIIYTKHTTLQSGCRQRFLQQLAERAKVKIQILWCESEMVAKLAHPLLKEHQCEPDALGLFGGHGARIKAAYGLPFHQLTKQLNEGKYELHETALDRFWICTDSPGQRIQTLLRDSIERRSSVIGTHAVS